ncbi:uncharacterized protein LOC121803977 [Salvia splendens]|uniref:uncharacterized protein LOC121803977 n=1 Tax=Salvia splendens TaxID=180675 RepID=UPI001C278967|nr:uncharacterized protein LOC121803977 [Salvia splendens]
MLPNGDFDPDAYEDENDWDPDEETEQGALSQYGHCTDKRRAVRDMVRIVEEGLVKKGRLDMGASFVTIWIFAEIGIEVDKWDDSEQVLHARYVTPTLPVPFFVSVAYGKCYREGRLEMWDKLRDLAVKLDGLPWLVGGDFNTFVSKDERQGGSVRKKTREMLDFAEVISDCQLLDIGADGPKFTWARGDTFERLDRVFLGEGWANLFESTSVMNLPRLLSDHFPLLVERCWKDDTGIRGMINVQIKLSRLKTSLRICNRVVFDNIFEGLKKVEA